MLIIHLQVLLTNKLDEDIKMSYFEVSAPLLVSFTSLIVMSFNSKGGNKCTSTSLDVRYSIKKCTIEMCSRLSGWFGLRKDFCQFLLGVCPFLQEYANIAYNSHMNSGDSRANSSNRTADAVDDVVLRNLERGGYSKGKSKADKKAQANDSTMKSVAPIISIDMPD